MYKKRILEVGRLYNLDEVPSCEHRTDTFYDYTNGVYLWICNIANRDNEYSFKTGMSTKCSLGKHKKE